MQVKGLECVTFDAYHGRYGTSFGRMEQEQ
jgi:hypothetical protein